MNQAGEELKERTMKFALSTTFLCRTLPKTWEGRHVADQLFRSATSVAANYSAARRARTPREFLAKLGLVVEEADETVFWLMFASRSGIADSPVTRRVLSEARELLAIFVASAKTASANSERARS